MVGKSSIWAIVLATGGARCASSERISRVIARGQKIAGRDRCLVVAPAAEWPRIQAALAPVDAGKRYLQPCDRGTACSLLWPLVHIAFDDPEATVVVLPVDREDVDTVAFARSLDTAVDHSRRDPANLVLLGPTAADIAGNEEGETIASDAAESFHEVVATDSREGALRAREVVESGRLWGELAFTARAATLLGIFEWSIPWLVRMFNYWLIDPRPELESKLVSHLFRILPDVDFAERVLTSAAHEARVIEVPRCRCSDLGIADLSPRCRFNQEGCGLAGTNASAPRALPAADLPTVSSRRQHIRPAAR